MRPFLGKKEGRRRKEGERGGGGKKIEEEEGNKGHSWPAMVTHTFNPITLGAEAGGSLLVGSYPGLPVSSKLAEATVFSRKKSDLGFQSQSAADHSSYQCPSMVSTLVR